jgi:hypothetical protein
LVRICVLQLLGSNFVKCHLILLFNFIRIKLIKSAVSEQLLFLYFFNMLKFCSAARISQNQQQQNAGNFAVPVLASL